MLKQILMKNVKNLKLVSNLLTGLEEKHIEFADKLRCKVKDWPEDSPKNLALAIASTHIVFAETMQKINSILLDPKKRILKNEPN